MRAGFRVAVLSVVMISPCLSAPYDALVGVWNLNLESQQTDYAPGYPKPRSQTYKFEAAAAGGIKCTNDLVEADGKKVHAEYTPQFDGKDYPVKGDPNADTIAMTRSKPFMIDGTFKKGGQVTSTFGVILWGNGLLMTINSKDTRAGKTYENSVVYNKAVQ